MLFKNTGDSLGTFHARMGKIKDRSDKDLTEAEEINKRWQEYTEELYKYGLNDLHSLDGVVPHLELDILQCEVNWALGSITKNKANGSNGIPVELIKSLKDNTIKLLPSNLENSAEATGLEKVSF